MKFKDKISVKGFCKKCDKEHSLFEGNAKNFCFELIEKLEKEKRLDFNVKPEFSDPRFSTDYLFGKARGQMFGVMECENPAGEKVFLKAFSGQYNGVWEIDGWVPPVLNVSEFDKLVDEDDKKIKALGRKIETLSGNDTEKKELVKKRRILSQKLLKKIYALYELENFCGEKKSLSDIFEGKGIPTGTGDCCAPKLLNYAVKNRLKPLSLAEFYFGKENLSQTKKHKNFYPSCQDKCYPILGFILCGIKENE